MAAEFKVEYRILKLIQTGCYERLRELLTPSITDISQISRVCRLVEERGFAPFERKEACMGVVFRLFTPESLVANKRARGGVTLELAKVLGSNHTYISALTKDIRCRYQHIDHYRAYVEREAMAILEIVSGKEEADDTETRQ